MKNRLLLMAAFVAGLSLFASAQNKYILKANNANGDLILGDVTTIGFENQIEILAYSLGLSSCGANIGGKGNANCTPVVSDLSFVLNMDRSVNVFRELLLTGAKSTSMEFSVVKNSGGGSPVFYKIKLEDILISSLQESGSGGTPVPSVSISIKAARIAWGYRTQNGDGTFGPYMSYGWDIATNKPWIYRF